MALVSPVPARISQTANPFTYGGFRVAGRMSTSRREIVEDEPIARVNDGKIYVAVGKTVKESKSVLLWAIRNSVGKRICILHVHQPAQMIPLMGTKFLATDLQEQEVKAYHEIERQDMNKVLDEYILICRQKGVRAEKLHIEMESIDKGILELVSRHGIRNLVMGAAADRLFLRCRSVTDVRSRKAISVRLQAPAFCRISFVWKGQLIRTREATLSGADGVHDGSTLHQVNPTPEAGQQNLRSNSVSLDQRDHRILSNPAQEIYRRVKSLTTGHGGSITALTSPESSTSLTRSDAEGSSDEGDSRRSISQASVISSTSSSGMASVSSFQLEGTEPSDIGSELASPSQFHDGLSHPSLPNSLDGSMKDSLFNQFEQVMTEAENSTREALEETLRRTKAEKDAIEAIRRARHSENLYAESLKQRKEIEEALAMEKEELEKMKNERDRVMEELHAILDQKALLEGQIAESDQIVKELEEKIISAVGLLQNYKRERDQLQIERDNALREAEDLRRSRAEASSSPTPQLFYEFSFSEIVDATQNFDPSLKVGEGGYGSIYKGFLRHTEVAIKTLDPRSSQGPSEFQQEVDVLSKMRHPNLITLIGACPEAWALVYEYIPNGSLEDRLTCRGNSSPLSWQKRIFIAAELCSVLMFLHSSKPHSIVHGDLKPANILIDSNFVSKLSDFGIARLLMHRESSSNNTTICRTDPKGTIIYMDPEFLSTGELSPKSDVYSFGIILLRLLTGRPALGITKEVQYALKKGNLEMLLDPLAGDWPFVQAEQLARIALRCCEMNRKSRPNLSTDVWRILEPMKASCGGSSGFRLSSDELLPPPSYFICPIFQEVMRDPHVAADGYTYEAEALRGWLDSGHNTSPMTNQTLPHTNLVPNQALRSAILEWLAKHNT